MIRIALAVMIGIALAAFVMSKEEDRFEAGNADSDGHSQGEITDSQSEPTVPVNPATSPDDSTKVLNGSAQQLYKKPYSGEAADSYLADLSPTNIGPDLSPESTYPVEDREPESLGEFMDPGDPIQYLNRNEGERIAIGEFIDPDAP